MLDKQENQNNKISKYSFYNNYIMDIFLFIAAISFMMAMAAIVHIVCKHAKMKALVTGIAFQSIKKQMSYLVASIIVKTVHAKHNGTW